MKGKRIFSPLLVALLAAFNSTFAQQDEPKVLDEIVAKVNSEIITRTDLEKAIGSLRASVASQHSDDPEVQEREFHAQRKALLKNMIQNKLLLQRAEDMGVAANIEVDVAAFLEELRKDVGTPSMEVLDQVLRQHGTTLADYRQNVREKLIIDTLFQQQVYSKLTLLSREVETFYEENLEQFRLPAEVELAEILFLTEGKDRAQVREKAMECLAALERGDSFEELAREYSDGPSAANGGGIGTFTKGSMNEMLEEAAFGLEPGQTSGILEMDYGFQIIKVLKREDSKVLPLDEVRPQISEVLYRRKAQPELQQFLKELIEQSYIYIAPKYEREFDVADLSS